MTNVSSFIIVYSPIFTLEIQVSFCADWNQVKIRVESFFYFYHEAVLVMPKIKWMPTVMTK